MYASKTEWYQALESSLGLEPADLDELAGMLMDTIPGSIQQLESSTGRKDELRRYAHSIKGASSNLGLIDLAKKADELETMILKDEGGSDKYHSLLAELKLEYQAFVKLMAT